MLTLFPYFDLSRLPLQKCIFSHGIWQKKNNNKKQILWQNFQSF